MDESDFEWDETKRRENLRKHGIDFREVYRLFWNATLEDYDWEHSESEERYKVLGLLGEEVTFCVYTERGQKRRIVTARKATGAERVLYLMSFLGEEIND